MHELRYGFTMRDLQRLAGHAAATVWTNALPPTHRFEAAWDGVVEELYSADYGPQRWPTVDLLVNAGRRSVFQRAQSEQHHYGVSHTNPYEGARSMPNFERYWYLMVRPYPSPESRAVETVALAQIMAQLTPREREVLTALAAFATYQAAADALRMELDSFRAQVTRARRHFFALWHEGEAPSRIWRIDRRVNAFGETERRTSAAQLRSHRRVYQRKTGQYPRARYAAKLRDRPAPEDVSSRWIGED